MTKDQKPTFIDLFSGCGGLSLGMAQANWKGIFAIEKADDAFKTFEENLINGRKDIRFDWPTWLPQKAHSIDEVLVKYKQRLASLRQTVDVITGGPPCQGFSFAGKRLAADPRNLLFEKYVEFVASIKPRALLLENVPGMKIAHGAEKKTARRKVSTKPASFYAKLVDALDEIGYVAEGHILDASHFGVPQRRCRLIVIGIRKDLVEHLPGGISTAFAFIDACRKEQLEKFGLSECESVANAISDLEIGGRPLEQCDDPASPKGFGVPSYRGPKSVYQRLMHDGFEEINMDSTRLAKHREHVRERFRLIIQDYKEGGNLSKHHREKFGLLKYRIHILGAKKPSPTVTTLPDDLLHYSEPRILSVRENARLQSFPDWFKIRGKYTTGGDKRKKDCPRYTQIGNAVPPLLARAIGIGIARTLNSIESKRVKKSQQVRIKKDLVKSE